MIEGEAQLYMDVECTRCGRLLALTNAIRWKNEYLCPQCATTLEEMIKEIENDVG